MRGLGVHLGRVGALQAGDVARELADGDVHAEADAEVGDLLLARDLRGVDLALPAAPAEAARDQDRRRRPRRRSAACPGSSSCSESIQSISTRLSCSEAAWRSDSDTDR